MDLCILSIGKISAPWIQQGLCNFESRIERYIKFSTIIIPDIKNCRSFTKENLKEEEGKAILQHLSPSDCIVIMDEKGKEFTSLEFSDWVQKQMNSGRKRLVIIIGGPYGFSQSVYDRAHFKIALSKMTFTHEMAKLIITEQLYRAFTILKGEPYHHQ